MRDNEAMSTTVNENGSPRGTFSEKNVRALRRYTWWSLAGSGVVILLFWQVAHLAVLRAGFLAETSWIWLTAVKFVAVAVGCVALVKLVSVRLRLQAPAMQAPPRPVPLWMATGGVAAVVDAAIALAVGDYGYWYILPTVIGSVVAMYMERRLWKWIVLGMAVTFATISVVVPLAVTGQVQPPGPVAVVFVVVFLGYLFLAQLWIWDIADDLDYARRVAGDLAVADERLRFAADLHDIQGHHLQVIALKSELAARLAENDSQAAAVQMHEVHQMALDAQHDTKKIVQGMRQVSLDTEIANATRVLDAADIDSRMQISKDIGPGDLPGSVSHVLGLVMREAVTNVLRHSRASCTDLQLTHDEDGAGVVLMVANDGVGDELGLPRGLRSLRDRTHEAGGTLDWEGAGGRFIVTARMPVQSEVTA